MSDNEIVQPDQPLKSPRHELAVQYLALGDTATEASRKAGFSPVTPRVPRVLLESHTYVTPLRCRSRTARRAIAIPADVLADRDRLVDRADRLHAAARRPGRANPPTCRRRAPL